MANKTEMQRRSLFLPKADFVTREENGKLYLEAYFAVFGDIYKLWENASETIAPGAFDETLNGDIKALVNHDTTLVLGRTTANTLFLKVDERGLWGRIEINPEDGDAMNLYARVKRGDVSQCSFGFDVIEETPEVDETTGSVLWTLRKIKLYEVSVVTFPAYEQTSVSARQKEFGEIQRRKLEAKKASLLKKLKNE